MSWSGGKDSALALARASGDPTLRVAGLLTTVTAGYERVSMHGVRRSLLAAQADALALPVREARIPSGASNDAYEAAMLTAFAAEHAAGISRVVFGDLYLRDVRHYRVRLLERAGMEGIFPLWQLDTRALAEQFIAEGFRAVLVCVDPRQLSPSFCGREFDAELLADLPEQADPCGENGEFHTFVYDGPIFGQPLAVVRGEVVERGGFWFCDLLSAEGRTQVTSQSLSVSS